MYDEFFYNGFGKNDTHKQGDIFELYVDFDHLHFTGREDINATGYKPANKFQDTRQHHDCHLTEWLWQLKNTRHVDLYYTDKEDSKGYKRSNVWCFLAEQATYDHAHMNLALITTAFRKDVSEEITRRYKVKLLTREDIEPWFTKAKLVAFIEYLKAGQEHFKRQKEDLLKKVENFKKYDYQVQWNNLIKKQAYATATGGRFTIDHTVAIGQGGGKTDMEKDFIVNALKQDRTVFYVAHRLKLIDDQISDIVPKVHTTKGLKDTSVYAFGSRPDWTLERYGFDIGTYSASRLDEDTINLIFKGGASLIFITYDQLHAVNNIIEELGINCDIVFDEIASQAPRYERMTKSKEKKHWAEVLRARNIFLNKAYFDANYTEKMAKDLNNLFIQITQKDLIEKYGVTIPIDLYVVKATKLPKELNLRDLKEDQKRHVGVICRVIQNEVNLLKTNNKDSYRSQGLIYNTDAISVQRMNNHVESWIETQDLGKPVNMGAYTSHQSLTEQESAMKTFDIDEGVNILNSKNMLARGINKRRMVFGVLLDNRNEEELSHSITRFNRKDDRDGFEPESKVHKPRARLYVAEENAEFVQNILAKMMSTGLTCGNIIVEDRTGNMKTVSIEKYLNPDYETIKGLAGTKLQEIFQIQKANIEAEIKRQADERASRLKTEDEILAYLNDPITETA